MFCQLAIFAALVVFSSGYHLDLDFMTSADMERYFDVSSPEKVPEYEIVSPTAFSAGGRRKRHIEMEDASKEIKLQAFGEEFHMKLEENTQLLATGLEVEKHNADGTVEKIPLKSRRCFYQGELLSHEVSKVAVSTCDGLTGMIATDTHDMFIRPLNKEHAEEYRRKRRTIENPHIIYRRSVDQEGNSGDANLHFCALDPNYEMSAMLYETMEEMQKMQTALGNEPVEVQVDFADDTTEVPIEDVDDRDDSNNEPTDHADGDDDGSRRKRALPTKYLEVRVLADADMLIYHGQQNVIPYTLTLMNIVATRFAESSLGRTIIIHIVKLGYLSSDTIAEQNPQNGQSATLFVSKDGGQSLYSWSDFQYRTNPFSDSTASHWDNAVLISRKNLETNGQNSLLGIAWGNSTCYGPRQASVSQDQGLSSGIVIAHEIGHTLGMRHDSNNGCQNGRNVMSSHRPNGPHAFVWSSCSAGDLETFLRDPYKQCLNDQPTSASEWPLDKQVRPGSELDADRQCELQSTDTVTFVSSCTTNLQNICTNLFCRRSDEYCYSSVAAAEGTSCGTGKWCVSGQCVDNTSNQNPNVWDVTNGPCSVTCGTGVATQIISCKSPSGQSLSRDQCDSSTEPTPTATSCNAGSCPSAQVYWQPFTFGPCSVTCGSGIQTRDVLCVRQGEQGFTQVSESDCNPQNKPSTTQQCSSSTPCPVQGVWVTSAFSQCSASCGGGVRTRTVTCQSSATSSHILSDSQCPGTKPSTSEDCNQQSCPPTGYSWFPTSTFGSCSVTCGSGTQSTLTLCIDNVSNQFVDDIFCAGQTRPQETTRDCFLSACPVAGVWVTSPFSQCSASCGSGIRTRTVICRSSTTSSQILNDSQCQGTKPATSEACNQQSCPPSGYNWFVSSTFGPCSVTCGSGTQTTVILCVDNASGQQVADTFCSGQTRPQGTHQSCNNNECPNTPANDAPDEGDECAGVFTRPVNNLNRVVSSGGPDCKESIVAQPGQQIKLTFSQCNIPCSQGFGATLRDGYESFSFCCDGSNGADGKPYSWTSDTHIIQMEHPRRAGQGYAMKVEFVGQPENSCDSVFTNSNGGTVTSPNYPSNYPNNQICQTVIIAPPGKRVVLQYQEIRLYNYWHRCYDKLEVYDLDSRDGLRYCGSHSNPSGLNQPPHENRVLVQFISNDDGWVNRGFVINYKFE